MKGIKKLVDGQKGIVFKIIADDDSEHVIKLQGERPGKAIVGAEMLQSVGVNAPNIESVKGQGLTDLQDEVAEFIKEAEKNGDQESLAVARQLEGALISASTNTRYSFPHVVRMDYASGVSLGDSLKKGEDFRAIMTNPQFQKQLGQIMAGDAYTGNGDRFMSMGDQGKSMVPGKKPNEVGNAPKLKGWFNPGNLIIEGTGKDLQLKAIDNTVTPGNNVSAGMVQGNWTPYFQFGSIAAASPAHFKREIFAVAELMEKQAGIKLTPEELRDFVENTTNSAKETIDLAMQNGLDSTTLQTKLEQNGEPKDVSQEVSEAYGQHQQTLKMMSGSLKSDQRVKPSVSEMMGIAKKNVSDDVAKKLLNNPEAVKTLESSEAVQAMKDMKPAEVERFKKLIAGERGDHVPKDFKVTVKEAALMAKDESVYKQFTHKAANSQKATTSHKQKM